MKKKRVIFSGQVSRLVNGSGTVSHVDSALFLGFVRKDIVKIILYSSTIPYQDAKFNGVAPSAHN